jgi:hypothetical protein
MEKPTKEELTEMFRKFSAAMQKVNEMYSGDEPEKRCLRIGLIQDMLTDRLSGTDTATDRITEQCVDYSLKHWDEI